MYYSEFIRCSKDQREKDDVWVLWTKGTEIINSKIGVEIFINVVASVEKIGFEYCIQITSETVTYKKDDKRVMNGTLAFFESYETKKEAIQILKNFR